MNYPQPIAIKAPASAAPDYIAVPGCKQNIEIRGFYETFADVGGYDTPGDGSYNADGDIPMYEGGSTIEYEKTLTDYLHRRSSRAERKEARQQAKEARAKAKQEAKMQRWIAKQDQSSYERAQALRGDPYEPENGPGDSDEY